MQLTGKQIVEFADKGIIFNTCPEGIQQQGVDVRLKDVFVFCDIPYPVMGKITKEKSHIPQTKSTNGTAMWTKKGDSEFIVLEPGYYEVMFEEGCKLPNNMAMYFKTRSSLVRCGAIIHSGQFDGGFETQNMGAFLQVIRPIEIERGARIAQAIVSETYVVDEDHMYNGQWQNDNQRA